SHKFTYRLKGEKHKPHIKAVGEVMGQLVVALEDKYGTEKEYKLLKRVFEEHFKQVEGTIKAKEGAELAADTLQSPDDVEATYRSKRGKGQSGYVTNVTETVGDKGDLNLITKVQTAPNVTDDAQLLNAALPDLVERTGLETMWGDGGYGSPEVDETCRQQGVVLHQTGIRGAAPDPEKLTLSTCAIELSEEGQPQQITCPHGKPFELAVGRKEGRFIARLTETVCLECATQHGTTKRTGQMAVVLYFSRANIMLALRRQRLWAALRSDRNPRAAVEATVRELTCRLDSGRLRVRGQWRVSMTLLASAAMCNARRIWRFQQRQHNGKNHTTTAKNEHKRVDSPLFRRFWARRVPQDTRHYANNLFWNHLFDVFDTHLFSFSF
ncbi:MAG: transposase, partial [Methylococcales bacterium]|nr:transposase [Methylococcales bacterium]